MIRLVFRDIRSSFGRWIAIFAIIALGVGFLSGLLQTGPAMLNTMSRYVRDTRMYDWRVVLPDGIDPQLLARAQDVRGIRAAESAAEADALVDFALGSDDVMRIHSVTGTLNLLTVRAGRLPEAPDECLADGKLFTAADIGTQIHISARNDPVTRAKFAYDAYTIVGIVNSPLYINYERGTTSMGSGTIRAFFFLPRDGFAEVKDTDLFLSLETDAPIYSESYDRILRLTQRRLLRFAEETFGGGSTRAYLFSRNNNVGFASFQNDADIVTGIARVFPVFFFLVAALVCVNTMTRMVDEQRTQIGIMRALGFGSGQILSVYLLYSCSAALLGCVAGFFLGTATVPRVIWRVYQIMYQHSELQLRPDPVPGLLLTLAFLAVSGLATVRAVFRELKSPPAQLLRPRPPKAGRFLFAERISAPHGRRSLLWRVTLRGIVRNPGRLLMTVVGIAGCTALLVAAHGIRDSIAGVVSAQFEEVALYDYLAVFEAQPDETALRRFAEGPGRDLAEWRLLYQGNMDLDDGETIKSVIVVATEDGALDGLVDIHSGAEAVPFPPAGEALICPKLAEAFRLRVGDVFTLRDEDGRRLDLTVAGVADNYFYSYIFISLDTFTEQWGETPQLRTVFANAAPDADIHQAAASILEFPGVVTVLVNEDIAARLDRMMSALEYIVLMVLVFSGALAFIVLYNLTNISIIERVREIATVKVLGFRARETAVYVFRENILLTVVGALLGLPLGKALHRFVMEQIHVDLLYFELRIVPQSYLWSLFFTFVFVAAVDVFMYFRLERIHMAEALKSNE